MYDDIVTISCPIDMDQPEINKETAPIWVDASLNQYYVASGIIPGEATPWTTAAPDRITIIVGMNGLEALAIMGLTLPEEP